MFKTIERLVAALRRHVFNVPRGESVTLVVTGEYGRQHTPHWDDLPLVRDALAPAGFTGPWSLAYHYEGEDVNLVRFFYDRASDPAHPFRQDHVRLFIDEYPDGEIGIAPHTEASALAHKQAHIDEIGFDPTLGHERVRSVLEGAGVDYYEQ